jgi:hypothetical protein
MTGEQPARRRFFFKGLDPAKFEVIEREMEERERARRSRALAAAVPAAADSSPTDSGAIDWGDVAAGLRHLAQQLRQVAAEGPG